MFSMRVKQRMNTFAPSASGWMNMENVAADGAKPARGTIMQTSAIGSSKGEFASFQARELGGHPSRHHPASIRFRPLDI